jgi:hypothetical protein
MALPATDNFTNSNGTALTSHSASWTANTGAFDIQSNTCQTNTPTSEGMAHWNADAFSDNQYAKGTIADVSSFRYIGPGVRIHASAHTGYEYASDSGDASYFGKFIAGSYTQFASSGVFSTSEVIKITAEGTTITAYIDDAQQHQQTDSAISSGSAGISGYGDGQTRIDDWEGGDLGGAPPSYPIPEALHSYRQRRT